MRIIRGLPSFPSDLSPSVVALGAFDGIHLAHARILETAVERARGLGVTSLVCTFDPNPAAVLRPERAPAPLASLDENLARIAAHGPDATLVIPFTEDLSRMEAEAFVEEVLRRALGAREVVVGFNHTFGRGARGTAMLLKEMGDRQGFTVHVLPPLEVSGQIVSSSAIREALRDGDVEMTRALLGRPYMVRGQVLRGAGRGPPARSSWRPASTRPVPPGATRDTMPSSMSDIGRPSERSSTGSRCTCSTSRAICTIVSSASTSFDASALKDSPFSCKFFSRNASIGFLSSDF